MKIIYLHQYFKTPSENGGTRSYDLAKSFIEAGHKVDMLTTTSDPSLKSVSSKWVVRDICGIQVHYMFLPYDNSMSYVQRILTFLQFVIYSTFRLLKVDGNVLLATSTPLTIGIPALLKKWFHRVPLVFEVRDVWPEAVIAVGAITNSYVQKVLYFLEGLIYKYADVIVPLSSDMQKSIISRYPKFREKAQVVIENIAELKRFDVEDSNRFELQDWIGTEPRFSILYAGTFGKVNNIDFVVELAEKLLSKDPSICLILLGAGSEKERIVSLCKARGLYGKNIFFPSSIGKDELKYAYAAVNMGSSFVAPIKELWANSANKFFDTLASGRPILVNHRGWQAEVIEDRNVGFVLDDKLTDEDVDDFIQYTMNRKNVDNQGCNARLLASEKYSLELASIKYLKIFNRLHV